MARLGLNLQRNGEGNPAAPLAQSRILLISRVDQEREQYARALQAAGYCTLQANSAGAGCRLAAELRPDVVVLDIDGVRSDLESRQLDELKAGSGVVPMIRLVTATTGPTRARTGLSDNSIVVQKPCPPEELTLMVAWLANRSEDGAHG